MIYKHNIHLAFSFLKCGQKVPNPINIWISRTNLLPICPSLPAYSTMKGPESPLKRQSKQLTSTKEGEQGKHIEITANSYRAETITEAIVSEVYPLSPSVKGFTLQVLDPDFTFYAGQWVDVFVPTLDMVGGFSLCSPPSLLEEERKINLGIKKSSWLPAHWFYEKCHPGSEVSLRVGGDFYFPHEGEEQHDLLLIAGGVGVNPIFSILSHHCDLRTKPNSCIGKMLLLFSAKTQDELLYKALIDSLAEKYSEEFFVRYFVTRSEDSKNSSPEIQRKMISIEEVAAALNRLNKLQTKVYICGPPSMIEQTAGDVVKCGIPESSVYYEKWW